jgi:hypothetical protein
MSTQSAIQADKTLDCKGLACPLPIVKTKKAMDLNLPQHPNAYQQIRHTNRGKLEPSDEEQRDMEMGPNRCAVHDN